MLFGPDQSGTTHVTKAPSPARDIGNVPLGYNLESGFPWGKGADSSDG